MTKRTKILLIVCCAVICCVACVLFIEYMSRDYDIIKKDGKCYMSFRSTEEEKEEDSNTSGAYTSVAVIGPRFSSVAEMKNNIKAGNLPEEILYSIRTHFAKDGVWEICDLDKLYDARLPDKTTIRDISLLGTTYAFNLVNDIAPSCYLRYCDEEWYNKAFQEDYSGFPNASQQVIWEEQTADRNATIKYYKTGAGNFKRIEYTIQHEGRILYVVEDYILTIEMASMSTSDTIPRTVMVFGEENGAYFHVSAFELLERPSVEWLTSFGMVPFEG